METTVAFTQSGASSTVSWSNRSFKCWFFLEGVKPENPEKSPGKGRRSNNKLNPHIASTAGSLATK